MLMLRRHPSVKLLLTLIVFLGLAVSLPGQEAQAAGSRSPQVIQQGDGGGSTLPEVAHRVGIRQFGDPDEYTQTGGTNPRPTPGGTSIYIFLLGYLQNALVVAQGFLFR